MEAETTNSETFKAETFEKVRALLPAERLKTHLQNFDGQLAIFCQDHEPTEVLEQKAHKLVSQAGMLGFFDLSERCRQLENACRDGESNFVALQAAKLAAGEARLTLTKLLAAS